MTYDYAMLVSLISDDRSAAFLDRAVFKLDHLFPTKAQHRAEMDELDILDESAEVAARIVD